MGYWNLYFAAKLLLAWAGILQPAWALNLLLGIALLLPLRNRRLVWLRQALAIAAAAGLAVFESSPAAPRMLEQSAALSAFSPHYLLELAGRMPLAIVVWPGLLALLMYFAHKRLGQTATFVLLTVAAVPVWHSTNRLTVQAAAVGASPSTPSAAQASHARADSMDDHELQLRAFRSAEGGRRVSFSPLGAAPDEQFDIIVLHVCSLSWDDLNATEARNHPLLARFDYVFENFNSATSYSNPAAIRLLRASCGQQPHDALFGPTSAGCHLFVQLAHAGYEAQTLFNHDGRYDGFQEVVEREIGLLGVKVKPTRGLPIAMRAFDGSPLVGDHAALQQWYDDRLAQGGGPVALYYNTVSLHDGNRLPQSRLSSLQSYPLRTQTLLDDVDKLIAQIERAGRRAALVFVPEHGAAMHSHDGQVAGVRETPTPALVHVPVGVRLVGLDRGAEADAPVVIRQPSSYLALAQLLSNLVADSPYGSEAPALANYAQGLPQTRLVSEN
ncbi:MAG: cellulose biosynthesis protein BcsG, partial [Pigmentiphaga sp.]